MNFAGAVLGNVRRATSIAAALAILAVSVPTTSQSSSEFHQFLEQNIGLTQDQVASLESGQAVAEVMPSRVTDEAFLFAVIR